MTDASVNSSDTISLDELSRRLAERRLPPVETWQPAHTGHSGMRIARDGTWFHQGTPIHRPAMVRLFASVLRREPDGRYVLVTPVEKLDIDVEAAPFVAIAMRSEGSGRMRRMAFHLNTGDAVVAGPDNRIALCPADDGPVPYIHVRRGLEARIDRPVYYELAEAAIAEGATPPGLWSDGVFMPLADGE